MSKMNFTPAALPVQTIMNMIKNVSRNGLDLQPLYQRGYVWSEDFKYKLIYSIIKMYPIGSVSIRNLEEPNEKKAKSEVVDGQQRLTNIYNFIFGEKNGEIMKIRGEYARKIIEEIKDYLNEEDKAAKKLLKKLDNKGKISITYNELPEDVKLNINAFPISVTNISNANDEQITEYFNFLQNQERLRAGEIINSMPDTQLEKYLLKINDKEKFLKIIEYTDNRKEFDKIFYSLIGVFDKEINFGTTDKIIKEYVGNKVTTLNTEDEVYVSNMINTINHITDVCDKPLVKANKRYLKLLLLIGGFNPKYFENNTEGQLLSLKKINTSLSAFNSAKKDMIEITFKGIEENIIEKYRLIALLTKGAHPFERVKERIEILVNL